MQKQCPVCSKQFQTTSGAKRLCSAECRVVLILQGFGDSPECWPWPASRNPQTGYGQLSAWVDGKHKLLTAHRVSYQASFGAIPEGKLVCHSCDNRACINPAHLFLGDQLDNMHDMWRKGRGRHVNATVPWQHAKPERVPRGEAHHLRKDSSCLPRGSAHPSAKLKEADVLYIRQSGEKGVRLAERFGVAQGVISAIRKRRTWRHLP